MDAKQQIRRATTEIRGERPVVSRGRRAQWCNLSLVWGAGLSVAIGPERRRGTYSMRVPPHQSRALFLWEPFAVLDLAMCNVRGSGRTPDLVTTARVSRVTGRVVATRRLSYSVRAVSPRARGSIHRS